MMRNGARLAGLVALALVALVVAELRGGIGSLETAAVSLQTDSAPVEQASVALAPVFTLAEPEQFHDLAERPLFVADRRPPQPVVEQKVVSKAKPKPAPKPDFVLSAIVREGNRWIAVIGTQGRGSVPPVELEVGGVVAGWKVERIAAEGIVLRKGKQKTEITLRSY
jgi:hypothetical protein